MENILSYFNTFLRLIFGSSPGGVPYLNLSSPSTLLSLIQSNFNNSYSNGQFDLITFIGYFLRAPSSIFSLFVWTWFAVLVFNLLLVFPYKWIRSVIRKCKI